VLLNAKPMRAAEATRKFQQAIKLSPEGRFYLNLCMSLYQEGRLADAHRTCDDVARHGGTTAQVRQAALILERFIVPRETAAAAAPP